MYSSNQVSPNGTCFVFVKIVFLQTKRGSCFVGQRFQQNRKFSPSSCVCQSNKSFSLFIIGKGQPSLDSQEAWTSWQWSHSPADLQASTVCWLTLCHLRLDDILCENTAQCWQHQQQIRSNAHFKVPHVQSVDIPEVLLASIHMTHGENAPRINCRESSTIRWQFISIDKSIVCLFAGAIENWYVLMYAFSTEMVPKHHFTKGHDSIRSYCSLKWKAKQKMINKNVTSFQWAVTTVS